MPEGSCMRLSPLQAVAQKTGRRKQELYKQNRKVAAPAQAVPFGAPYSHDALTLSHTHHTLFGPAALLKPQYGGPHIVGCHTRGSGRPRGRPPMRGPGGAPHGRCQPV